MYRCHLCNLETKQLNGLMGKHCNIHCSQYYSKDQYKIDCLTHNGRPQKICKICNKPTKIPKGEAEYPDYHKECYTQNKLQGSNNPNYKVGSKKKYACAHCNTIRESYSSQIGQNNVFCSTSCSTQFYNIPENQSEAKKKAVEFQKDVLRKLVHTEEFKAKRIAAMLKNGDMRSSQVEQDFHKHIQTIFPDAINGYQLDFYSIDIWIPSQNIAIDVQGNYWHNDKEIRIKDRRKNTFFKKNRSDIKFYTIWESEIRDSFYNYDQDYDVTILCGPSGSGKTWVGEQLREKYEIIDYDKIPQIENLINICQSSNHNHKLLITPIRATWIAKELRFLGLRVRIVGLIENEAIIDQRLTLRGSKITHESRNRIKRYNNIKDKICMFYGTQDEVIFYLKNLI